MITWEQAVQTLRQSPEKSEIVKANFYDDPLIDAAKRYHNSSEWKELRDCWLPSAPGLVLDLGAGRGISSYAFAQEGWRVTALEPDKSAVVGAQAIRCLARENKLDITTVEEWGEQLSFNKNEFDLVFARAVLHHAGDLGRLCSEIARVLKPGGVFIAVREHVLSHRRDLSSFLEMHPLQHLYGGENAYTLKEYSDAITGNGELVLCDILNPFNSEINLFPRTRQEFKEQIAAKLMFPYPSLIPDVLLRIAGYFYQKPGRLFSFIAKKKNKV